MTSRSSAVRWLVTASLWSWLALVLQVTFFPPLVPDFFGHGVVPNLCLLVVVAAALVRGPEQAAVLGFVAGLLLDLAPPADHVAGRWALALVVVGYVAGRMRPDTSPTQRRGLQAHGRRRRGDRGRVVVRRHLDLRASAACCCRTPSSRSATCCP